MPGKILLTVLIILALAAGISFLYIRKRWPKFRRKRAIVRLMRQLEKMGYFKYADPTSISRARSAAIALESPFAVGVSFESCALSGRILPIDYKGISQGNAKHFLLEVQGLLEKLGVKMSTIDEPFEVGACSITVDGRSYEIYSAAEQTSENLRELATTRVCLMINDLLKRAGSPETAYLLPGGEAGYLVFLTPAMQHLVQENSFIPENEKPQPV